MQRPPQALSCLPVWVLKGQEVEMNKLRGTMLPQQPMCPLEVPAATPTPLVPTAGPGAPPLPLSLTLKGILEPVVTVEYGETDRGAPKNFN